LPVRRSGIRAIHPYRIGGVLGVDTHAATDHQDAKSQNGGRPKKAAAGTDGT
jgi:hypothetical protein